MPKAVIEKVYRDTRDVLADAKVRQRLVAMGVAPVGNTPAEMEASMATERRRWSKVVADRNIRISP